VIATMRESSVALDRAARAFAPDGLRRLVGVQERGA